jgi:hypothetical protein
MTEAPPDQDRAATPEQADAVRAVKGMCRAFRAFLESLEHTPANTREFDEAKKYSHDVERLAVAAIRKT